ncbi:BQ5605_C011g06680 [Microbotryum silenes-dioicae]|uniref:BQ5605_C011g06680 protein n=1 Tax=Microbotryum silenes-dioicae TaxID=796604 RepID=A0A2X0LU60_9BASI|nr:BQ5605_C011g06680 [Microbotryum silenes-dioicae]
MSGSKALNAGSLNQPTPSNSSTQPHPHPQSHPAPLNRYPPLFLAVDGGGSGVRAVIASHAGVELARASAGPCNVKSVTAPVAVTRILQAVNAALTLVPLSGDETCPGPQGRTPDAVPSLTSDTDQEQSSLMGHCFARHGWAWLAFDFDEWRVHQILMILAMDLCIDADLRLYGWLGPRLGDEGSAYSIGRLGIRSVLSYFDELYMASAGKGPTPPKTHRTCLMFGAILRYFGATTSEGLIDRIYSDCSTPQASHETESRRKIWIADSARIVLEHAFPAIVECVESKRTALGILAEAQAHLIDVVLLFVDQLRLDLHRTVLTLGGSLWTNSGFAQMFLERLEATQCVFKHVIIASDAAGPAAVSLAQRSKRTADAPTQKADELELHNKIR